MLRARDAADVVKTQPDVIPFGDVLDETAASPDERFDVGVLFAELAHAQSLVLGRSPREIAALLEAFIETVGAVTAAHGGYAERRDLCAVLSVFGAPASCTRAADAALASAREVSDRLAEEMPEVALSIGISAGARLAGWIQATRRFEPLAIVAPASEARRLCELAALRARSVLASERALARASSAEAGRWSSVRSAGVTGVGAATPVI